MLKQTRSRVVGALALIYVLTLFWFLIEIPNFDLDGRYIPPSRDREVASPIASISSTGADTSGPSSPRTSISGRSGSAGSSRSTSFSLPNDARREIRADSREPGEEVEFEEEMDEESECDSIIWPLQASDFGSPAAAKHAAFVRARGRHYSNEAEAMKVFLP